ncbi:hypothetical protein [Cellulosilyticum sp. I15G10I2]|uniref:hypothetical protein n=1 Tax=Cellulosilyticum sp. I15G10I2 TaxID=1892843 RepID=UPI00085C7061|nr:hypothetical protein [Cellulosilyticum sp. I15G10I2]
MHKILDCDGVTIYLHCADLSIHNGFVYVAVPNVYDIVINNNIEDTIRTAMIDQQCQYILQNRPEEFYSL